MACPRAVKTWGKACRVVAVVVAVLLAVLTVGLESADARVHDSRSVIVGATATPTTGFDGDSDTYDARFDSSAVTLATKPDSAATRAAAQHLTSASTGELRSAPDFFVAAETTPELASGLERTGTALTKGDPFHRSVSWVVDNPAAQRFAVEGGDGVSREMYQLPGEVNGKSGVFDWIIDRSGSNPVINHQRFIPGGSVTGFPNQVVP
jgi:hypothetical protein